MKNLIAVRQQYKSFGRGTLVFLNPGNRKILAYLREFDDECTLCIVNLSRQAQPVELDLSRFAGRIPVELLGGSVFPPIGDRFFLLTLQAHAFYWFILAKGAELPRWHLPVPEPMPELVTLVLRKGWDDLVHGRAAGQLAKDILPLYLPKQRWFAAKDRRITATQVVEAVEMSPRSGSGLACVVDITLDDGAEVQRYFLPLKAYWDQASTSPSSPLLPYTLAWVRRHAELGALGDATMDPEFTRAMLNAIREGGTRPAGKMTARLTPGAALAALTIEPTDDIRRIGVDQSNTSTVIGDKVVLKIYRRLLAGIHPEIEIGRFLTDVAHYPNVPPLLGSVELIDEDGTPTALMALQGFVANQGSGWTFTQDVLRRELENLRLENGNSKMLPDERFALYLQQMETLGKRTAEMHHAFALTTGDPAFDPEPMTSADIETLITEITEMAEQSFAIVAKMRPGMNESDQTTADLFLGQCDEMLTLISTFANVAPCWSRTRHHGDYHLGQVLIVENDFILVDFEGEPSRNMDERRAKKSPLRDVAGMVRSFDYAAWIALGQLTIPHAETYEQMKAAVMTWRDLATASFLGSYLATIDGCVGLPHDPITLRRLFDLLLLEKAFYEIAYEAANRPTWLSIPISGALGAFDRRLIE